MFMIYGSGDKIEKSTTESDKIANSSDSGRLHLLQAACLHWESQQYKSTLSSDPRAMYTSHGELSAQRHTMAVGEDLSIPKPEDVCERTAAPRGDNH